MRAAPFGGRAYKDELEAEYKLALVRKVLRAAAAGTPLKPREFGSKSDVEFVPVLHRVDRAPVDPHTEDPVPAATWWSPDRDVVHIFVPARAVGLAFHEIDENIILGLAGVDHAHTRATLDELILTNADLPERVRAQISGLPTERLWRLLVDTAAARAEVRARFWWAGDEAVRDAGLAYADAVAMAATQELRKRMSLGELIELDPPDGVESFVVLVVTDEIPELSGATPAWLMDMIELAIEDDARGHVLLLDRTRLQYDLRLEPELLALSHFAKRMGVSVLDAAPVKPFEIPLGGRQNGGADVVAPGLDTFDDLALTIVAEHVVGRGREFQAASEELELIVAHIAELLGAPADRLEAAVLRLRARLEGSPAERDAALDELRSIVRDARRLANEINAEGLPAALERVRAGRPDGPTKIVAVVRPEQLDGIVDMPGEGGHRPRGRRASSR